MSTRIVGRLAIAKTDAQDNRGPLPGVRVSLRQTGSLFDFDGSEIGHAQSQADGGFTFTYRRDNTPEPFHRELELVVQDHVGRVLPFATPTGREVMQDVSGELLTRTEDFVIREADATGLLATLGTGTPTMFSTGNRVKLLLDHEAFAHAAALMRDAEKSILMSQLFFSIPVGFNTDATQEITKLIFDFHPPPGIPAGFPLDVETPRAAGVGDARPERILLEAADRNVDVRILLHGFTVPLFIKMIVGLLIFPFAGLAGVLWVTRDVLDADLTDTDECRRYFGESGRTGIKVQEFQQPVLSAGVMHAKLMVVDGKHALSIGSPFGQSYVDTVDHRIDAWIRGGSEGLPKHDAGFGVSGPAVRDIHQTLKLLWDTAAPADPVAEPQAVPAESGEGACAMQVVRTLTAGRFSGMDDGEKGILEAYQRAIAAAKDYVYLETQYFTNDAIGDALVGAMKREPGLQVIVVLNIEPDVPSYPFKQRRLITRIRKAIGQKAEGPQRFGVFTRWRYEMGSPRPRMLPTYVHAKVGIVDDRWATIGSANLDGLSLDASLPSDIFRKLFNYREQRAIEVNGVMIDTPEHPSDVVKVVRRTIWAEHLGFRTARDVLDPDASELLTRPADGWLALWRTRAGATLKHLVEQPLVDGTGMAPVLPWPEDDTTYKTPRLHLTALKIRSHAVVPLKSTRAFDFEKGEFKEDSKAKMDYD
jgi:phosphatidylserine/phosphatidylglycerophosphate/cardiolipin synthase-like enzyme